MNAMSILKKFSDKLGGAPVDKNREGASICRRIRPWLYGAVSERFGLEAQWVQRHLLGCARCRRRLAGAARVDLALAAVRAEPHEADLLKRSNAHALAVLKHSLRRAPKAQQLREAVARPRFLHLWSRYAHATVNVAACLFVLALMKVGVISTMDKVQSEGTRAVERYYASQLGRDMADELFKT